MPNLVCSWVSESMKWFYIMIPWKLVLAESLKVTMGKCRIPEAASKAKGTKQVE